MAQVILYPAAVDFFTVGPSGSSPTSPAVVGGPPQWADGSDSTYAHVEVHRTGGATPTSDRAYATLDLLSVAPASVTAIHASLRASATSSHAVATPSAGVALYEADGYTPGSFTNTFVNLFESSLNADYRIDDDGAIRDYQEPASTDSGTLLGTATALAAGCVVEVTRMSDGEPDMHHTLNAYELAVVVTYESVSRVLQAPPRRLTQRGDGLTGGAPRLTGSRSRQASNRLLGGYL